MKVLWFTNTILPDFAAAIGLPGGDYGGWMPALVAAIRECAPGLELHIASEGPVGKTAEIGGAYYYSLGRGRVGRGGRVPNPNFANAAKSLIDAISPDLIHVHGSEGPYADFPPELWAGQRIVVSLQGIINAYYYYYGNLAESDFEPFRNRLREWLKGHSERASRAYWKEGRSASERRLLNAACLLLGRTDWDKAWATRLAPEKPYVYVGEIMRPPFYAGKRSGTAIVPHSVYCGAALASPLKNGHVLLEAVAALRRTYPDIVLHVANAAQIGRAPSLFGRQREGEYIRYLRQLIKTLGIGDRLVLHPSLSAENVRNLLEQMEVFCLPSACENSPNSLGEAMLTGTPSIATYVGGVPSILANGVEGWLVPSGDSASLADAIDRMFTDRQQAQQFAECAYVTAVKRYDPNAVVAQLVDAYNKAGGGK